MQTVMRVTGFQLNSVLIHIATDRFLYKDFFENNITFYDAQERTHIMSTNAVVIS